MRRKDRNLLALMRKKKKLPFYGKVAGGNARARPDRKALGGGVKKRQEGGHVEPRKPSDDPSTWRPKCQAGGAIGSVRRKPVPGEKREPPPLTGPTEGLRCGGIAKRQEGGNVPREPRGGWKPPDKATTWPADLKRQEGGDVSDQTKDQAKDGEEDEGIPEFKRGGHLSAAQRRALPSSSFALPGKGKGPEGKGSGSYPIPDESHARSALSRGKQHASPEKLATIKRKVKAKFPGMQVS
jgi:hypothetical protein